MLGFICAGYSVAKHNWWAFAAFILGNMFLGLVSAMNEVGKVMTNGNSSTSK